MFGLPIATFFVALVRAQQQIIKISSLDPVIIEVLIGFLLLFVAFASKLLNDPKVLRKLFYFLTFGRYRIKFTQDKLMQQKLINPINHGQISQQNIDVKTQNTVPKRVIKSKIIGNKGAK